MDEAFQNKDDLVGRAKKSQKYQTHTLCWKLFRCEPVYDWGATAVRQFSPLVLLIRKLELRDLKLLAQGCAPSE